MPHKISAPRWTVVEREVLRALSIQVKYLTVEQVARGWLVADREAECLLERLAESGLAVRDTIEVYDAPQPTRPLLEWRPGDAPPTQAELAQIAQDLAVRWGDRLSPVNVFRASPESANSFGATTVGSENRSSDWSHDLFISEVLLRYRDSRKPDVKNWLGESFVPKLGLTIKGMKDPDAFLVVDGRIERIIEIGGKYTVEHLRALHEHCAGDAYHRLQEFASNNGGRHALRLYDKQRIPYEIW